MPESDLKRIPVGASLLAMVVNDNAGSLTPRGVLRLIASRLAPTGGTRFAQTRGHIHMLFRSSWRPD
ncbi:hypothetical protein CRX42_17695 [Pseudomonas jessenii]|uniref:Uncharacterized protein n=1 Tax=Pseudomonas jessenii TaxID=77298 RepID=A0A2W0EVI9_PSEJE|nr:hypothetical protein CRX42_17695 [Pseudomonas jessenii]